ncbi:MAG: choice-of-anchor D domain-containing protein [Xanthomonadales bacterium]|nr:choice-of-anchor D domain-containing protein [Gammaproteobacteria bacterium]NND58572.1 choice-of-anchor D domain-containing protein [Xanthomonadales bacterium]NNK51662.1 choice-of-anchor D domain-containing protein [Xanthomonadales bacterium]
MKRILLVFFLPLFFLQSPLLNASEPTGSPRGGGLLGKGKIPEVVEIRPGTIALSRREIDSLIFSKRGAVLRLPTLDEYTGNRETSLEFTRIGLFAPGARVEVVSEQGRENMTPGPREFYLAGNATTGVGLAVNPDTGEISGFINRQGSKLEISGNIVSRLQFSPIAETPDGSNSCATGLDGQPPEVLQKLDAPSFFSASAAAPGEIISYQAIVAVDTDSEWLDGFNDDADAAMNWIADAFLAMNVFYERDVETRLLMGDVILRLGSDPYSVASGRSDQLDEFGAYWKDNMADVERQFAMMMSGRDIGGYGFSGIAWLDQFCEYGRTWGSRTVGSFSFNAIGSSRTPGNTAIYLGHELGHNMGSPHTHCYNPPVDSCYNAEGNGCFSGDPVCPAAGRGTIMSYCHVGGSNGAGCGTSNSEFHPTVQSLIESNLAVEMAAGCIMPFSEQAPEPEFESSPVSGSTLNFGSVPVGTPGSPVFVQVSNTGSADLVMTCGLSGPDSGSFSLSDCPSSLPESQSVDIQIACSPQNSGDLTASLNLTTNDADEGFVTFGLQCSGESPAVEDLIFSVGFEAEP